MDRHALEQETGMNPVPVNDTEIKVLSDSLINEIVKGVGLPDTTRMQNLFRLLFHRATERLATYGLTADRLVTQSGVAAAARWMISHWCKSVCLRGSESIPREGPVMVLANHAGTYDAFVLASSIARNDLKIISNDLSFFRKLPHIADHLFLISNKVNERAAATRAAIRHLQNGGAFLIFGSGRIDPDPAVYPGADGFIDHWSPSIDLFLRTVPRLSVVVTIVSGVLSRQWGYHPLTWLRRLDWQKRRVAEIGQVVYQLLFPDALFLTPRVSFSNPVTVDTLRQENNSDRFLPAIINRGKFLLADHLQWLKSSADSC
jgi:hypothetical protein